jgi:DNA-binding MarR family transcriptional regulator
MRTAPHGVSDVLFNTVLFTGNANPALAQEIATHLGLSVPAASRAVDGLVERDFVTRREPAEDRRTRLVALTGYGREVVDRLTRARLQTLGSFVDEITPEEQVNLLTALLPIVERITRQ